MKKNRFPYDRMVAALLALVCLLGLLPTAVFASSPSTITMTDCVRDGHAFTSPNLGDCDPHLMTFEYEGTSKVGFCAEHGRGMGWSLEGQTWGHPQSVNDPTVKSVMAYYYACSTGTFTDEAMALGVAQTWDSNYSRFMSVWVQAVVWRYKSGTLGDPVTAGAEELMYINNSLNGTHHSSIDELMDGTSYRDRVQYILDMGAQGVWGNCEVSEYTYTGASTSYHPASNVQAIMIGKLTVDTITHDKYTLTVKKVDAADPSKGLAGAKFQVTSMTGSYSREIVTGADGSYTLRDLDADTFSVVETGAPEGYEIDSTPQYVTLPGSGSTVTVTFMDTPEKAGEGSIRKVDADDPTKGLAGAVIKIEGVDNDFVGTYTTGEGGYLTDVPWDKLPRGSFTATEVTPPEGYTKSPDPNKTRQTFEWDGKTDISLIFENDAKVKVQLIKQDDSGHPLPGAVFNILKDGQIIGTEATKDDGSITVTDVTEGTYAFVEVSAPAPFACLAEPVFAHVDQATINGGGTVTVTASDLKLPTLIILKKDGQTGKVIPGTTFEIKAIDGSYHNDVTTGQDGKATLANIPAGSYEVTEKSVPDPYVVGDAPTQTIYLAPGESRELIFDNMKQPELTISKVELGSGKPIPGTVFTIKAIDSDYRHDVTTGADGTVTLRVAPGSYRIIEQSVPEPYCLAEDEDGRMQAISLNAGDAKTLIFKNSKSPLLKISKIEKGSGTPIPGTVFTLEAIDGDYRHEVTTGANGSVELRVAPGSYKVTEKSVPEPYVIGDDPTQTVSLHGGDEKELIFENSKQPLLTIAKIDADSGAPIPNTVFTVRALDGTYQDDWKTGADGKVSLRVAPGVYRVTEKSVPSPYYLPDLDADRAQTITLSAGDDKTMTFRNRKAPELTIFKENSVTGEAIEHAKFHVTYTSNGEAAEAPATIDFGEMFTDARGEIKVHEQGKRLYPGEYTITEVEPADGFQLKEPLTQTVIVHGNESKRVVFQNTPLSALVVWKYDSVTGAPVEGAVFQVKYMSGTSGTGGTVIGTYKTGPGGSFTINRLKAGAYTVEELASDGDHVMDTAPQTAYISGKEQDVVQLYFGNSPKGAVLIKKIDAVTHEPLGDVEFFITDSKGTMLGDANGKFVTDSHGTILISNIDPGTTIVARESRAKENYLLDDVPQTVTIQAGRTATLEFRDQPKGSVTLYKFSGADRRTPLEGVGFKITYADGKVVDNIGGKLSSNGIYYTDSEGQINISGVTGTLIFTEVSSIPGYLIDENRKSQTIVVNPDDHQSVYFYNQPIGSILVKKMSSTTKEPLSDVVIRITRTDGSVVGTSNGEFRTDENGFVRVDVEPGSYIIQEVKSKSGFLLDDTPKVVEVKGSGVYNIELFNQPLGSLVIHKYSSLDRKTPLAGVQFKVTYAPGCVVDDENGKVSSNGIYYTESDGTITIDGIVGTVVVTEQATIPGYTIDPDTRSQTIVVNPNDVQHAYFYNTPKNALIIEKYLETEGADQPLKGVTFQITDSSGAFIGSSNGEYITGDDGRIVITGLEPGTTVHVREIKAPDGVVLDSTVRSIKISEDGANILRIVNRRTGYLVIRKLDKISKSPLSGVEFELTYADGRYVDDAYGHLSSKGRFKTDDAGEIRVPVVGTIVVKELTPCPGYVIDQATQIQTVTVNPADTQTLTVYNEPLCSLTITKVDAVTGKPVPNTEFTLKDGNGNVLGRYTTGADGTVTVTGLVPNSTVVVVESKVPSNYVLDPTPHTIIVRNGSNSVTSGVAGNGNVSGGTTVGNGDNNITVENVPKTTLVVEKYVTGTTTPLKGVTFLITDSSGAYIGNRNGEFDTDENGRIVIEGLEPGTTIIAKEIRTLEGYILDGTPKSIKIKTGEAQTLRFYNQKQGALVIRKLDSVTKKPLAGVEFQLTYADGSYVDADNGHLSSKGLYTTDRNGEIRITGITGTVIATETKTIDGYSIDETARMQTVKVNAADTQYLTFYNAPIGGLELIKVSEANRTQRIPNVKFEIRRMDGGLVDTVITDKQGRVHISLDAGNYYAVEIETTQGFKLDDTPHYFTIQDGKTTTLTVTNAPFSGVIIHKVDSVTGEGLYNVKFLVYDQNKNPIGEYSTDNEGFIYIDDLTVQGKGKLFIRELEAAPGYELDKEYKTVYVQPGKTIEITWENTPITGQFQIYKYAAEYNEVTGTPAGAPLQGAVYEISEARSGKVVDYITTDARGVAASKPLPLGRYKIVEVTAPAYWQLSGKTFDETLEYSGQIIKVSDYDKPSNLGVVITKRGNAEALAGSQMRYDFTVANTSNVPLSDFYWHDRIPTDAARATVLTTGTYSARLNYRILYKTNYSTAYQVLTSNLITSNSYSFSLNAIPTQAGEYVTDVYFDFGKVPVGFQSVANPTLTVTVSGTAANGYQLINRADVGGQYQGTWQTAQATWVTVIRKLTTTIIPTLPKTGY